MRGVRHATLNVMSETFRPRRHCPRLASPPQSALARAMAAFPADADRRRLLETVNWDLPDMAMNAPWDRGDSHLQTSLFWVHPLSTVAMLGDDALFETALALADHRSDREIWFSDERQTKTLARWEQTGVLETVAARGSVKMLQALLPVLQRRHGRIGEMGKVWDAVAQHSDQGRGEKTYARILSLLTRAQRAEHRAHYRFIGRSEPPANGGGPLTVMEKRWRRISYTAALESAATAGNAEMLKAILASRHAQVTWKTLKAALDPSSGSLDLAQQLLENLPETSVSQSNSLFANEIFEAMQALGQSVARWEQVDPKWPKEWAGLQLTVVPALVMGLLQRWNDLGPAAQEAWRLARKSKNQPGPALKLAPALVRLENMAQARTASAILWPESGNRDFIDILPSLEEWQAIGSHQESPWWALRAEQVAQMTASQVSDYLDLLGLEAMGRWRPDANMSAPRAEADILRLGWLWERWGDAAPKTLVAWVDWAIASFEPAQRALIHAIRLGTEVVSPLPAKRPMPRL